MRQDGVIEGALPAKHEGGWRNKGSKIKQNQQENGEVFAHNINKRRNYPPCKHCNKLGHPPFKCWRRPDAKCNKCNQLGHEAVICRNQSEQQDVDAQIADEEEDVLFVAIGFSNYISSASWLIDSGCPNHMTYDKEHFKELKPSKISKVEIGHEGHISVKGIGTIVVATHSGTKVINDLKLEKGYKLMFGNKHCLIKDVDSKDLFKVEIKGGKFFALNPMEEEHMAFKSKESVTEIWHKRLGHFHHRGLLQMQSKKLVEGLSNLDDDLTNCRTFKFGKQHRHHSLNKLGGLRRNCNSFNPYLCIAQMRIT